MHAYSLELVKTMKMPSDDQASSVIPQMHFHVHGNTFFLLRKRVLKRANGHAYMESLNKERGDTWYAYYRSQWCASNDTVNCRATLAATLLHISGSIVRLRL